MKEEPLERLGLAGLSEEDRMKITEEIGGRAGTNVPGGPLRRDRLY